jgi:hypothetical protein
MTSDSEFLVNSSFTDGNQLRPSVSTNTQGSYIIAWYGLGNEGNGIYVRKLRFDSNRGDSSEFRLPTPYSSSSINPSVALRNDETFVVVWQGLRVLSDESTAVSITEPPHNIQGIVSSETDIEDEVFESEANIRDGFRVFVQIYKDSSQGLGPRSPISSQEIGEQLFPVVSAFPDGSFVVAWQQQVPYLENENVNFKRYVRARIYDVNGNPQTNSFQIDAAQGEDISRPSVASLDNGDFIVVWADKISGSLYAQKYSSLGRAQGNPVVVNDSNSTVYGYEDYTSERLISVDSSASNNFVIAWSAETESSDSDSSVEDIYMRIFDSTMSPITNPEKVDSLDNGASLNPCVAMDKDGSFAIIWDWQSHEGIAGVYVKTFDPNGATLEEEHQINTNEFIRHYRGTSGEIVPVIDMDDSGNFIAAWMNNDVGDTAGIDIYAQQSELEVNDLDGNYESKINDEIQFPHKSESTIYDLHDSIAAEIISLGGIGVPLSILSIVTALSCFQRTKK